MQEIKIDHFPEIGIEGKAAYLVWCQKWEESERGWGTRPDGYSLHLTFQDAEIYIREYWDSMPDAVPDEYSRPDGNIYPCLVDKNVCEEIKDSKNGIRRLGNPPRPFLVSDEDVGGWVPLKGGGHGYIGPSEKPKSKK